MNLDHEKPLEMFEGLVRKVVWQIALTRNIPWHVQMDDLLQEGRLGLWRAQQVYKPGNHRFTTFAGRDIRWAVKNYIRTQKYLRFSSVHVEDPSTLYDYAPSTEAWPEEIVAAREVLEKLIPLLSTTELEIIKKRFIDDDSWKEVSEVLGLDEQQHKHIVRMIRKKIKDLCP